MKRCAILLHEGFELVESLATFDILSRSHAFNIDLLSDMDSLTVKASCQVSVEAHKLIKEADINDYELDKELYTLINALPADKKEHIIAFIKK